jgi:hypothetical protein
MQFDVRAIQINLPRGVVKRGIRPYAIHELSELQPLGRCGIYYDWYSLNLF